MPKRVLQGVVVSDKQDKTVVVKVERRFTHPVMKKTVRRTKNYSAHDEDERLRSAIRSGSRSTGRSRAARRWAVVRGEKRVEKTGSLSNAGGDALAKRGDGDRRAYIGPMCSRD